MKVFFTAFLLLQFDFVFFWHKNIGAKAASKMLMKLTTGAGLLALQERTYNCI